MFKLPLYLVLLMITSVSLATETDILEEIFDQEWQHRISRDPIFAKQLGKTYTEMGLVDMSPEALSKSAEFYQALADKLKKLDVAKLSKTDRVNYQIFSDQIQARISYDEFGMAQIPFNSDSGFYSAFSRVKNRFQFKEVDDYQDYLKVLDDWHPHVKQQIALMQKGLDRGFTQPKEILGTLAARTISYISSTSEKSSFYAPFRQYPDHFTEEQKAQLTAHALQTIEKSVNAGYQELADFFANVYVPNARETIGAIELPNGKAFYADQIRLYTTLNLSPEEIHKKGLEEVKRIRGEMEDIIKFLNFDGTFADFLHFLRTDPRFYAETEEALLSYASRIAKRMDAKLPKLFKTLPRTPYGIEPVPAQLAPNYTTGRYVRSPRGSTEPGYYWVNTYALDKRPLYEMEALTLHEAVPGHHLQIALSQELGELPKFRQNSYISAYGEGWGLYSEWLGLEVGFYTDPYSNFGRLTYEMWRAVRLVVDTGMHAMGWTRQEAIDYLASNTALSLHNVRTEIDRYIAWPAQALSYKLGEMTIRRLRTEAETELGADFDVREFHEVVLSQGAVPLNILIDQVRDYIESTRK